MPARPTLSRLLYWTATGTVLRRLSARRKAEDIVAAGLFDGTFYLKRYADIAASGIDAAEHYVEHGAFENRRANAIFDVEWYGTGLRFTDAVHDYLVAGGTTRHNCPYSNGV
jgi:hypothetical protein